MELSIDQEMTVHRDGVMLIPRSGILKCLLILAFSIVLHLPLSADDAVSKEYQLKAAFLYNFAKYVEWPAQSFGNAESPIVIGVFGRNPFGDELEKAVNGKKINGRRIMVILVASAAAARQTHLLFVGSGQDAALDELKGALKGSAVLSVGESEAFAKHGGLITFTLVGDSLRFAINRDSVRQKKLKISSQLQKLAIKPEGGAR